MTDFVPLSWSPLGTHPTLGNVAWNTVDAAITEVPGGAGINWQNAFLPVNALPPLAGAESVAIGDDVFKVGRTTGLTGGTVTSIRTVVGPVGYGRQQASFQNSIEIVSTGAGAFSGPGDSGSAIVKVANNKVVALLYAGNGTQTYACRIDLVLSALGCALA